MTLRGYFFIRLNNVPATFIDRAGQRQFRSLGKYAHRGMADILVMPAGRSDVFLEVKQEKGRISPEQHEFGRKVILSKRDYHIVRSIDDVQKFGL